MVTKFPLVAGLFALVFAIGSLCGVSELGAGTTAVGARLAPRLTDCLFWVGVTSSCLIGLALYSLLLQKLGILGAPPATPRAEGQTQGPDRTDTTGATHL